MFDLNYVEIFKNIPAPLAVLLISMIPIAENRAAIPIALGIYKMSILSAIFWASIGDIIITVILVLSLRKINDMLLGKICIIDRIVNWLFARAEKRFVKKHERWGEIALMLFVGVPLPITGAWTGSIASFLFDIKPKRALLFISLGVIISSIIISLASLGMINLFNPTNY